ncbi:unnamed protein product [Clavelina lepadiformis]|uniref:Uncharacterized protein n=1 Tax=Clavelina lepadiformis TaxID=159417 RepID=A0ABP0FIG5_CLALP
MSRQVVHRTEREMRTRMIFTMTSLTTGVRSTTALLVHTGRKAFRTALDSFVEKRRAKAQIDLPYSNRIPIRWNDTKSKALSGSVTGSKVMSRQVVHRTERDMRTRMILTMTSLTTGVQSTTALLVHTGRKAFRTALDSFVEKRRAKAQIDLPYSNRIPIRWHDTKSKVLSGTVTGSKVTSRQGVHRTERDMRTRIILTMTSLTTGVRSTTALLMHTGRKAFRTDLDSFVEIRRAKAQIDLPYSNRIPIRSATRGQNFCWLMGFNNNITIKANIPHNGKPRMKGRISSSVLTLASFTVDDGTELRGRWHDTKGKALSGTVTSSKVMSCQVVHRTEREMRTRMIFTMTSLTTGVRSTTALLVHTGRKAFRTALDSFVEKRRAKAQIDLPYSNRIPIRWHDTKGKALSGTVTSSKVMSRQVVHRTEREMRTRMIFTMTSLTTGVRSTTALLVHTGRKAFRTALDSFVEKRRAKAQIDLPYSNRIPIRWNDTKGKALSGSVTGSKVMSRQVVHRTERDMRTRMILTMTSLTTGVQSTTALLVHTGRGTRRKESAGRNSHRQQSDEPSGGPSD